MPNLEAQAAWVPVREIGIELARGGPNGNMNEQAIALLARTEWLNQQKASKSEIVQGHYEFNTYAEFNAIKSTLPLNCTVIINEMPTGTQTWGQGTNRWNGTTLSKSAYDPKAQAVIEANLYSDENKLDLSKVYYEYVGGNLVGNKSKTIISMGLNGSLSILSNDSAYDSIIIPINEGDALYIFNDLAKYNSSEGAGFAFFAEDPNTNRTQSRIIDNRTSLTDPETLIVHQRVIVPVGAKYLMLNTRFYNSAGTIKDHFHWAVHKNQFINSYTPGKEFVKKINGVDVVTHLEVQEISKSILNISTDFEGGNILKNIGSDFYSYGLNGSLAISYSPVSYDAAVIPVDEGDALYIFNDLAKYSSSEGAGFAFFAEDPSTNTTQSRIVDNRASLTDPETAILHYKVTVPVGAKYLMLNTRFYNSAGTIKNNFHWAVHKDQFINSYTPGKKVVKKINDADLANIEIKSGFSDGNLVKNFGVLNPSLGLNSSLSINAASAYDSVSVPVNEGKTLFIFNDLTNYNSSNGAGFAFFAEDPNTNRTQSRIVDNRTSLTDPETAILHYKVTVPAGAKYLMLNTRFYNSAGTIKDHFNWAVHKDRFVNSYDAGLPVVEEINGMRVGLLLPEEKYNFDYLVYSAARFYGKKVFCFGDSITQGTEGGYVKYITQALNCEVSNYGSSGAAAKRLVDIITAGAGIPRRDSNTVSTNWPVKDFTQCSAVTIQIGTNDYHSGSIADLPTTSLDDYSDPLEYWALFPSNYVANIALCIEYIKSKNQECEIFLITPPYRNTAGDLPSRMTACLPYLEAISQHYSIPLINSMFNSGIGFKYMAANVKYSYDGVHFNALGNKLWGKYIARGILNS